MGILERLYKIARSNVLHHAESPEKDASNDEKQEQYFESAENYEYEEYEEEQAYSGFSGGGNVHYGAPKQVVEDLAVFNLKPPSSIDEVRRARNREIKKYHSDKFMNDNEKLETSKQIMQIFNAAYDRLKEYYKNQTV